MGKYKKYDIAAKLSLVKEYLNILKANPKYKISEYAYQKGIADSTFNDWLIKYKKDKIEEIKYDNLPIMFHNACAFKETTYRLINKINEFSTDCSMIPIIIVNGLFSAELYLKFLFACKNVVIDKNIKKSIFLKGHKIYCLYTNLPKKVKTSIIKLLEKQNCKRNEINNFISFLKRKSIYSDAINWRYLNDNKTTYRFNLKMLIKLLEALYCLSQKEINNNVSNNKKNFYFLDFDDDIMEIIEKYCN